MPQRASGVAGYRQARRSTTGGPRLERRGSDRDRLDQAARQSVRCDTDRPRRTDRHRLGCVWSAGVVSGEPGRRCRPQVRRPAQPGSLAVRVPAADQQQVMKCYLATALLFLITSQVSFEGDTTQMPTPELQKRYLGLTHELRCMQCQNEAIADSPVSLAAALRRQVREMLLKGQSDEDVRNYMVARYGDFILFRPRVAARTLW